MPQIWLSYPELAAFLGCAVHDARPAAVDGGWSRRRCSDGLTRVKLSPAAAERYMRSCTEASAQIDEQVASLREILDEARHETSSPTPSAPEIRGVTTSLRTLRAG